MKKHQQGKALIISTLAFAFIAVQGAFSAPSFNQAVANYNAGKYGQAAAEFETLKAAYPNNSMTRYYLALCRQALGHFDKARDEYQFVATNGDARLKAMAQQGLSRMSGAKTSVAYSGSSTSTASASPSAGSRPSANAKVRKILKFTAVWCGPCKRFAPIYEETSKKFSDVRFETIDIDQDKATADKYQVQAIPHLVFLDSSGNILYSGGAFNDEESFSDAIKKFH